MKVIFIELLFTVQEVYDFDPYPKNYNAEGLAFILLFKIHDIKTKSSHCNKCFTIEISRQMQICFYINKSSVLDVK